MERQTGFERAGLGRAGLGCAAALAWLGALPARAQGGAAQLDSGDTAWLLVSSAIVLLMTLPALALFYGGLVRAKNVLSVLMQCLISAGLVGVLWVLAGYSLAFSEGNGFIGGWSKFGLAGIDEQTLVGSVPEYAFAMFQLAFAVITPALMSGACAERMRFSAYLWFISLWLFAVYIPLAHNVWGGGWLASALGAKDFAGGLVVHLSSGCSALVAALFVGQRRGYGREPMPPHSLPLTVIGAALLWVGWFGFNAGSALAANGQAALAFLNTHAASSSAVLGWVAIEWWHRGQPTVLGAASAAVAGLVAITPACAYVTPLGALAVGFGAAGLCYVAVTLLKPAWGYDDSLDVFGIHGVGGIWGALATGLFITPAALGASSWGAQVLAQLISIAVTAAYASAVTLGILFALRAALGSLRVDEESEQLGLDLALHSESAYTEISSGSLLGGSLAAQRAAAEEELESSAPAAAARAPAHAT